MEQTAETAGDISEMLQTLWKAFHDANNSGEDGVAERASASIVSLMARRSNLIAALSSSLATPLLWNSAAAGPWKRLGYAP
jgi:hypothetical protein